MVQPLVLIIEPLYFRALALIGIRLTSLQKTVQNLPLSMFIFNVKEICDSAKPPRYAHE